ncbi:MAG TPA: hypothetical protein VGE95_14105, partial [Arthrobacter sp.]
GWLGNVFDVANPGAVLSFLPIILIGVLFDAFVVRMTIVPAVMYLLGAKSWWLPRWLDRILPDVDVEGAKLNRGQAAPVSGELVH